MYLTKNDKSPFYQLVYFVNGKRTTVSTKTTNFQQANKFLVNFEKDLKEPKQQIQTIQLSKFRDEYLDYIKLSKTKSYIRSVKLSFKMLDEFTGDVNIDQLDIRLLDKFFTTTFSRTQRGAALYYRTLKAALSKGVSWNYLTDNPLKKVKLPKIAKSFPVFINEEELKQIIDKTNPAYLKDLFLTAFYTGMRLGELVNLRLKWIDFDRNTIKVQCSESFITKSKKDRIIPINQKLKGILINRIPKVLNIDRNNFVFTRIKDVKLNEDFVSKQFKKSVVASGLDERIHFHTLRHSFASCLVQKGVSLYVIKELLGHEDLSTTQIYSHLQQQNLKDAVNLL